MLLIPTTIKTSDIQGIGLFALNKIPKGTVIWQWHPVLDHAIPWSEAETWPKIAHTFLHTYAYRDLKHQTWILCGDAMRHVNHSFTPNLQSGGAYGEDTAIRDIEAGEELTIDYRGFDPDFEKESSMYH